MLDVRRIFRPVARRSRSKGASLVIVMGALAMLAMLAVSFARMVALGQAASGAQTDGARARMLATAGIEFAAARLLDDARAGRLGEATADWRYLGEGSLANAVDVSYPGVVAQGRLCSGVLGSSRAPEGDQFALKILDTNSQIDLNGPGVALGPMLDSLGRAIRDRLRQRSLAAVDPIAGRGDQIVAWRERRGGFSSKDELRPALGDEEYRLVEDYLTIHAWVDRRTIAPMGGENAEGSRTFEAEPRAPINLNTASWPVLVAVVSGVEGPTGGPISYQSASRVAREIVLARGKPPAGRGPFKGWPEVYEFFLQLAEGPSPILSREQAWALIVNADPNFHPSSLNPERILATPFDKLSIRRRTTEFSLGEAGIFEISSLGRVMGPGAAVMAIAEARAVMRVFGLVRHTVQEDFEKARVDGSETTTWPNPLAAGGAGPAAWAGHVQLRPAESESDEEPVLDGSFGRSRSIEARARNGSRRNGKGPKPKDEGGQGGEQESGTDVLSGGDLLPDGVLFSRDRGELASVPLPEGTQGEGTLEFWVKFDERAWTMPITILLLADPETSEAGVQHRIRAGLDGETLVVESTRLFYVAESYGTPEERGAFPCRYPYEETTWVAVLPGGGGFHEWHHISVSWTQGTDQALEVDGSEGRPISRTLSRDDLALAGWPPYFPGIEFGGAATEATGRELNPSTIDALRLYDSPDASDRDGVPPERFGSDDRLSAGRFEGRFDAPPDFLDVLGLRWTVWVPRTWSGRRVGVEIAHLSMGFGPGEGGGAPRTGSTGVRVERDGLHYTLYFVATDATGARNVTPVVDEVELLYRLRQVECLQFGWVLQ